MINFNEKMEEDKLFVGILECIESILESKLLYYQKVLIFNILRNKPDTFSQLQFESILETLRVSEGEVK